MLCQLGNQEYSQQNSSHRKRALPEHRALTPRLQCGSRWTAHNVPTLPSLPTDTCLPKLEFLSCPSSTGTRGLKIPVTSWPHFKTFMLSFKHSLHCFETKDSSEHQGKPSRHSVAKGLALPQTRLIQAPTRAGGPGACQQGAWHCFSPRHQDAVLHP